MTSNHHAPYVLGLTRATMGVTKSSEVVRLSESQKNVLSSDCGLQPAHMKSELLVIPNQNVGVNAFPGLVHTARHAMGVGVSEVGELTARGQPPKVKPMTGVKS